MQARWKREYPSLLPIEAKPLPAWLEAPSRAEPKRPTRHVWIAVGGVITLGLLLVGGYWLNQRRQAPVARVAASPPTASVDLMETPDVPPVPQLAVGLPWLSGQTTTGPVAAQSPVPAPDQPSQLLVGLRPIAGQTPPDPPALMPAEEAPPPAEPLPSPAPPPRQRSSPIANPSQSSGAVKF
jgi:hypothetical protein